MGGAQGGAPDTLETARQQGFIRVGFFANEAPYGYADESGNLTGETAEVARKQGLEGYGKILSTVDPFRGSRKRKSARRRRSRDSVVRSSRS